MARTAVFGGSFNPIHYGHLLLADEVLDALGLDRVLFVPAAVPPHKPNAQLAPAQDRYVMVELAVAGHPRFSVSDVELRRAGPSYTVDTLEALRVPREELFLIVGSETFLDLLTWRAPRRVAQRQEPRERLVGVLGVGDDLAAEGHEALEEAADAAFAADPGFDFAAALAASLTRGAFGAGISLS